MKTDYPNIFRLLEEALAMKEEKLFLYEYSKKRMVFVPEDYDTKEAISAFKAGYAAASRMNNEEIKCEFCDFKEDYKKMRKIIEDINKQLGVLE